MEGGCTHIVGGMFWKDPEIIERGQRLWPSPNTCQAGHTAQPQQIDFVSPLVRYMLQLCISACRDALLIAKGSMKLEQYGYI